MACSARCPCLNPTLIASVPVRDRWREQGGPGSGIWYDLAPHLLDQAIQLFGLPVSMTVDLAQLRPGAQSTDYFHAILSYPSAA